jgi:ATP-dependent Zn protease
VTTRAAVWKGTGVPLTPEEVRDAQRRTTAYHEAGHAVAAVKLRLRLVHVHMIKEGDFLGTTRWLTDGRESGEMIDRVVLYHLMGVESGKMIWDRESLSGTDKTRIDYYIKRRMGAKTRATKRAYLRWLKIVAQEFVGTHREEISRVAEALLKKQKLTAAEVKKILRQTV